MPRHDPSEKTKSEILQTAVRLFRERGWKEVNIEDVVKEVGVTRGAFYHYFKSREELISAAADQMFFENNPFSLAEQERGLNALEKLRLSFKRNMESNLANLGMIAELQKAFDSDPVLFKGEALSQVNVVAPFIEKLLIEGNADGSLFVHYPKQTAQVLALLSGLWVNPTFFHVSRQEYTEKLLFFMHMTEELGVPFMDDGMKGQILKNVGLYEHLK